ncbi:MAG: hypothetical protein IBX68_10020 [Dehalococcoidia bacterium]|nr:hypothetical protein [Dehalococcoidia bacterium]
MTVEFVHQPIGQEITALAGYYTLLKELKLEYDNREVLAVTGMCSIESSCCGRRAFHYAIVPGYLVNWKGKKNGDGLDISEVEPLTDEGAKLTIRTRLADMEGVAKTNIEFW